MIALTLLLMRPRWRGAALLATVVAFGLLLKLALTGLLPGLLGAPEQPVSAGLATLAQRWLVFPQNPTGVGNIAFVVVVALLMAVSRMRSAYLRFGLLIPTLYLLAFVWETRLAAQPSVTRLLFFGAILVLLMTYRPHGLFGKPRVEVM